MPPKRQLPPASSPRRATRQDADDREKCENLLTKSNLFRGAKILVVAGGDATMSKSRVELLQRIILDHGKFCDYIALVQHGSFSALAGSWQHIFFSPCSPFVLLVFVRTFNRW